MSLRTLPDFLLGGDKALGFPHPTPAARMRGMMGMADPKPPRPSNVTSHDAPSRNAQAGLEWLWHVMEGRIASE